MFKIKYVLLGLLATWAVSTVAATTASAHEYIVEKVVLAGEKEVEAESQAGQMEYTVAGLTTNIQCEEDIVPAVKEDNIKAGGKSEAAKLEFRLCAVFIMSGSKKESTLCTVTEPTVTTATDDLTGAGEDTFTGKGAEEVFAEFEFKGEKCTALLKGIKIKFKGKELCTVERAGVEAVLHLLICTPGGSKVEIKEGASSSPIKLWTSEDVKLKTNEKWSSN